MKTLLVALLTLLACNSTQAIAAERDPASSSALPHGYSAANRQKICVNTSWKFHLGDPQRPYHLSELDDSGWEEVSIPHPLKLTSLGLDGCTDDKTQPTFHRTVGWYRKSIPVTDDANKKVFLEFEGAHQVTDLWVNEKHVGQHAVGGYTPFHFDISGVVKRGEKNQITLRVDNRVRQDMPPDPGPFDYVKFSGLYRDVYLVETDPVHITFNWEASDAGIFITTPVVDPVNRNAVLDFKTVVRNELDETTEAGVVTRVIDKSGVVVLRLEQTETILPSQDRVFKQIGAIEDDLHLWSIEEPYLYRVNTMVMVDGQAVDVQENRIGIRKFELDPVRGFLLNREPIELIGEMNVVGKYGFAYGEGVVAIDPEGLILEFADLPRGTYKIKTWHHASRSNTDSMDPNRQKLRDVTIHRLPYAKELAIAVTDAGSNARLVSPVTEGKEMQFQPAAVAEFVLTSDGVQPVRIQFKDSESEKGIWLNAFELSPWHEDLQ